MSESGYSPESLPSRVKFYNEFKGKEEECTGTCEDNIEGVLNVFNQIGEKKNEICGACCYVSRIQKNQQTFYKDRYSFLYYWIGDTVWEKLKNETGDATWKGFMTSIRPYMKSESENEEPAVISETVDRETFSNRKTVFEHYYDYKTIGEELQEDGPNCKDKWSNYLKKVSAACKALTADCAEHQGGRHKNSKYCKEFKNEYKVYCDALKHLEQKCKLPTPEEQCAACPCTKDAAQNKQLLNQLSQAEEKLRSATTTASISSIFSTLAATAIPVLLYKYKPWSSWFGNHTSGNGRSNRRKRRSAESTFDTFTESSSTYDSTEVSTIDGTVRSVAPTRQPNRERERRAGRAGAGANITNNNIPAGHHQRTNVGYGRM